MYADLSAANLMAASLIGANLANANLTGASLVGASLVQTNIDGTILDGAQVYGVAAWDLIGEPRSSTNLIVSPSTQITVSDLRVAQLVYMMISNKNIRNIVDALTSKIILILGRFSSDRKPILDALAAEFVRRDYAPVIFDFDRPQDRDTTETVGILARLARFIVADLTDPRSVPQELYSIAPHVEVPILPIFSESDKPWAMFSDIQKFPWVLPPAKYASIEGLLNDLSSHIARLDQKRQEILGRRAALEALR